VDKHEKPRLKLKFVSISSPAERPEVAIELILPSIDKVEDLTVHNNLLT
jgi:hypothetical protein